MAILLVVAGILLSVALTFLALRFRAPVHKPVRPPEPFGPKPKREHPSDPLGLMPTTVAQPAAGTSTNHREQETTTITEGGSASKDSEPIQAELADEPGEEAKPEAPFVRAGDRARRELLKRGGARRAREGRVHPEASVTRAQHTECVCWQKQRKWFLGVEIPEQMLVDQTLLISQNEEPLRDDPSDERRRILLNLNDMIHVKSDSESRTLPGDAIPEIWLFKLGSSSSTAGRYVRSVSSGYYIAIAPTSWRLSEDDCVKIIAAPEPTSLPGYSANCIYVEGSTVPRFRKPDGTFVDVVLNLARFSLQGKKLDLQSPEETPVFGPPTPYLMDPANWVGVQTIVVCQEDEGYRKNRWAQDPTRTNERQALPCAMESVGGGWFSVRFYDERDDLIESFDFKYTPDLFSVSASDTRALPEIEGYKDVNLLFRHAATMTIQLDARSEASLQVCREAEQTKVLIPAQQEFDRTYWVAEKTGVPKVRFSIQLERVWWAFAVEGEMPSEWLDKPITLHRSWFTASSNQCLVVRTPRKRWVGVVSVGFQYDQAREYRIRVDDTTVYVPLRDFGDTAAVINGSDEERFSFWLQQPSGVMQQPTGTLERVVIATKPRKLIDSRSFVARKKRAIAIVSPLGRNSSHAIMVNGVPVNEYFEATPRRATALLTRLLSMPEVKDCLQSANVRVEVTGSDPRRLQQAKAVAHALARVVASLDPQLGKVCKRSGIWGTNKGCNQLVKRSTRAPRGRQ